MGLRTLGVSVMASNLQNNKLAARQITAPQTSPSRFFQALNRFTSGLGVEARNPLKDKFGKGYEHLIAGDTCRFREELDTAVDHYRQALLHSGKLSEAYVGMAKCLRRQGNIQGAIQCLRTAIGQNAFHTEAHLDLAKCYGDYGFTEKAMHHYERAIRLNPSAVEARFGLALLVEASDDVEQAASLYQAIIQIDPEFLPAYNNLGSLYLRQNRLDKAEALFRALVEKAPTFTRGYLGLAMSCDRAGKCTEAVEAYETVMRLRPNGKNNPFITQRLIQMNIERGRCVTRRNLTLVRVK
jgi:tetratricopeptide (TPR) repeat protein